MAVFTQWKSHIVKHIGIGKQCTKLKQDTHFATQFILFGAAELAQIFAIDEHTASVGPQLARHQAQQCGFATARAAHDGGKMANINTETDIAQHLAFSIGKADGIKFNERCGHVGRVICKQDIMLMNTH